MTNFKAINWNKIANKVDYSAWSRLNDFVWEPERIPLFKDKKEFNELDENKQTALMRSFAALAFFSTLQVKIGNEAVKKDSSTPQEFSVFSALTYLEAIANKAYSNVIQNLAKPTKIDSYFDWANTQPEMQQLANTYINIYQNGEWWQKKIALSFMEMSVYHTCFFTTLRLFGEGKLIRTAEVIKLAIRTTSFNAMYPGVKLRLNFANDSEKKQQQIEDWADAFVKKTAPVIEKIIREEYTSSGWTEEAIHYFHYTLNKNFMNLGFATLYPEDADCMSDTLQKGLIDSANFEDFFYYSNENTLTKFHEEK